MKKIYINIGHSDKDPGAVGYEQERRLNVAVSNHERDYLLAHYDCEVRMNPGSMDSLTAIANDANQWGADLFTSNHFNAGKGDGYEALVYSEKRVELGEIFEKHVKAIGQNSRGVKLRPDLAVLRLTNMPAVLNEGAFVDNLKDIQDWNEDTELKELGIAYAKACAEYLELEEKEVRTENKTETTKEGNTVNVILNILRKGSKGAQVKALQRMLYAMGYDLGSNPVDGDFGTKTDAAVRAYQMDNGLTVDGIVGINTWASLLGA